MAAEDLCAPAPCIQRAQRDHGTVVILLLDVVLIHPLWKHLFGRQHVSPGFDLGARQAFGLL